MSVDKCSLLLFHLFGNVSYLTKYKVYLQFMKSQTADKSYNAGFIYTM